MTLHHPPPSGFLLCFLTRRQTRSNLPPCCYFNFKAPLSHFAARWINVRLNATTPPERSTALFPAIPARLAGFARLFPVRTAAFSACPAPPIAVRRRHVLTITAEAALEALARIPSRSDRSGPVSESRTMPKNSCPDRQSPARPRTRAKERKQQNTPAFPLRHKYHRFLGRLFLSC